MSHLCTLIQFIQNVCLEDEEVNNMVIEIDKMSRENAKLENQLEECDREHVRLQIQSHNLEMITSFIDISSINNLNQISKQMYSDCIELKYLIKKIDFTKILKCYHMEMEAKCRREWQPIKDCFAKTLEWHEKMEQRHIVQKYRQAEVLYREAEETERNQKKSMEESLKHSFELINQAKESRNNLVLVLINGSKELNNFDTKMRKLNQYEIYIEGLRQGKSKLASQLEQTHLKAFNPILSLHSNQNFASASKTSTETFSFIMPKLPSFDDILSSFNQTEKLTSVTSIENTTNICVKSILTTSKQSITTKQTKSVHFKMQLETESENDMQIEELHPQTSVEINELREEKENLQDIKDLENASNIEILDLLTPAENFVEAVKENRQVMDVADHTSNSRIQTNKNPLIQDCIIFKTPFPIHEVLNIQCNENVANSIKDSCSQKATETNLSSSSQSDIKEILNTTKKSFYEEFLEVSSSAEASPHVPIRSNSKNNKNFGAFFEGSKEFVFASKSSNEEIKTNETSKEFVRNRNNSSDGQDFLDFYSNKGFTFDSDENMMDNFNTGNMDFM